MSRKKLTSTLDKEPKLDKKTGALHNATLLFAIRISGLNILRYYYCCFFQEEAHRLVKPGCQLLQGIHRGDELVFVV